MFQWKLKESKPCTKIKKGTKLDALNDLGGPGPPRPPLICRPCYLFNRKQYISYNVNSKSSLLNIVCGVPQGSILGPLLFLPYINDLPQASKLLDPIMFADDTNLFFSGKDIHSLFDTVNNELSNISKWFNSNKLSLNANKTKYTFFHKSRQRDDVPLVLPKLKINNVVIERVDHIKFLGVLFDENLTWNNHISLIENKLSKGLGILHRARFLLDKKSMKNVYFSFIHSYINYGNIAWGSTHQTKLKKIYSCQKKASRIIFHADRYAHAKPLLRDMNALNVYQINIYQHLILMYKTNIGTAPVIFLNKFSKVFHRYPTSSINSINYKIPKSATKHTDFAASRRGPTLWNKVLDRSLKEIKLLPLFKAKVKEMILLRLDELSFF